VTDKVRDFCCYFDHRYFDKGVALYQSLMAHCPGARLWVLCLSDECHRALSALQLPKLKLVPMVDFEAGNPALAAARINRTLIEYYFTCTASFMAWVFQRDPSVQVLTYLDSDLLFFSNPEPIFQTFQGYSTLIIPHRFPARLIDKERYGKYNVGWLSFRRDVDGLACLNWWRDRCLEWCYDRLEDDRFADQKYLDRFPELFSGVLVLNHPGANLAPWNLATHMLERKDGHLLVDRAPLVFFHFHQFRQLAPFLWDTNNRANGAPCLPFMNSLLYRPYIRALAQAHALGEKVGLPREKQLMRKYYASGGIIKILRSLYRGDAVISFD
jgi:hypothetical protein